MLVPKPLVRPTPRISRGSSFSLRIIRFRWVFWQSRKRPSLVLPQ
jgi:hypothetical protein